MAEKRLPQLNVEITPRVMAKLAQLEATLRTKKVEKHEIVGVLIERATKASISDSALGKYRDDRLAAQEQLRQTS